MILVGISAQRGDIDRWVSMPIKERIVRTHGATIGMACEFTQEQIDHWRKDPGEEFRIKPDPERDPPPSGTPVIMRRAA